MNKKIVIGVVIAVGIGAAVLWKLEPWAQPPDTNTVFASGTVDATEIAEASWFGPDDVLPAMPPLGLSIAGHLIHAHLPQSRPAAA